LSCERNQKLAARAASRNGIMGQVNRYLNTLGNWSTYQDLSSLEDLPGRIGDVTTKFFGVDGLAQGSPRLAGILGVVMGVHAMEQVTGAIATSGMRLLARGRPLARYRGVIVRESKLTPIKARALYRLTAGRLQDAAGYYFHEGGRTWHCQSFTVAIKGTPRTLTHIRSLSLPHREHFFDRPLTLADNGDQPPTIGDDANPRSVSIQRVIDAAMGDEEPGSIPGYIGSTNEFENATSLGSFKRALFAANWFLVDESERDLPSGPDFVDYDALIKGKPPGPSNGGYSQLSRPSSPSSGGGYTGRTYGSTNWPSTTARTIPATPTSPGNIAPSVPASEARPYGTQLFRSGSGVTPPVSGDPYERIKDRYRAPNGQQYPLVIRGVKTNPLSMAKRADAIYYDGEMKRWREIVDDEVREALAKEVEAGNLPVTPDWENHL
jgi:hypothetical protein